MDRIRTLCLKSAETHIPGVDTPYGKKLSISKEEKSEFTESLSRQERDVYLVLLEGFTPRETARQLGIGYPAVKTYLSAVCKKLHVCSRAELIINYRDVDGKNE